MTIDKSGSKWMKMDVIVLNVDGVLDLSTFGSQSSSSSCLERVLRWSSIFRLTHLTLFQIYLSLVGLWRLSVAFVLTLTHLYCLQMNQMKLVKQGVSG